VVDLVTNAQVPSQVVSLNGVTHQRVMAPSIPSVGYKVFEIRNGTGSAVADTIAANKDTKVIENEWYRITLGENGNIASILDKKRANREFVRPFGEAAVGETTTVNSFGPGLGSIQSIDVENAGVVSKTLKVVLLGPLNRTTRITLYRNMNRIDIRNEITQNFGDTREWRFSFDIDAPTVRHDEIGAVLTAKLIPDGGNYSPRQARYDWLTANRFIDVTGGGVGITLSNPDLGFFRLGDSTPTLLDTSKPLIRMLAGGRIDDDITKKGFYNQGGATYFLQRFALQTHAAYNQTNAMKFALEHQTPFVAKVVVGGTAYSDKTFSLLKTSTPKVMLTALKVAEDGMSRGIVARFWNSTPAATSFTFSGSIVPREELTHIESYKGPKPGSPRLLNQEIATYLMAPP
jgi:alpha-mannosidase